MEHETSSRGFEGLALDDDGIFAVGLAGPRGDEEAFGMISGGEESRAT
jgi:hypothetical protein